MLFFFLDNWNITGVLSFIIPQQVDFETKNAKFFEDVEFAGGNTVLDFIFDEEYVNIPTGVIGINQDFNGF